MLGFQMMEIPKWAHRDSFIADTLANYTKYGDGSAATYSIAGGQLTGSAPTSSVQNLLVPTGLSLLNAIVEADFTQADDAGLVARVIDNSNYYLMAFSDGSSSVGPNEVRLWKRVAGTFTLLGGPWTISFVRGTERPFRFEVIGNVLKAYANNALVASVTDSSVTGSGGAGIRNNAAPATAQKLVASELRIIRA